MSRRPIELVDGRSRCVIVPRAHIDRRPSELAARRLLEDALREGGPLPLERLAEELAGREVRGPREATAILVRALIEGRLVAVALPRPVRPLAVVEPTDLRTLGGWDVDAPLQPRVTPLTPEPTAPTTWVSFEVVDERGVSAEGRYRIGLDARLEHGELVQRRHRIDGLPEAVRVDLTVEDLRWGEASPWPNAPSRDDDPRPAGDGLFSIELVDERGEPLRGCFTLAEGDRRLAEGVIIHRWRRALSDGEPVTLELTELRAQQEAR